MVDDARGQVERDRGREGTIKTRQKIQEEEGGAGKGETIASPVRSSHEGTEETAIEQQTRTTRMRVEGGEGIEQCLKEMGVGNLTL